MEYIHDIEQEIPWDIPWDTCSHDVPHGHPPHFTIARPMVYPTYYLSGITSNAVSLARLTEYPMG